MSLCRLAGAYAARNIVDICRALFRMRLDHVDGGAGVSITR